MYCIIILLLNIFWADWHVRFHRFYNFTYTLVEYASFTYLIFINITNKKAKILILGTSFLFVGFLYLFNFIYTNRRIDSIPIAAETLVLLIVGIYFFYEQFTDTSSTLLYTNYCFWLTIGIWIYLCGSLFIYLYGEHLTSKEKEQFWFFTYIVEIIKNILFSIAIIIYSRQHFEKLEKKEIPHLDIKELYNE